MPTTACIAILVLKFDETQFKWRLPPEWNLHPRLKMKTWMCLGLGNSLWFFVLKM